METNGSPTKASDILVPEEVVTLKHLRARDGSQVRVKVYPVSPLMMARAGMALPGANSEGAAIDLDEGAKLALAKKQNEQALNVMLEMSAPIIEDCTALAGEDGGEIRPAFYFGDKRPGSLPGRALHSEDLATLVSAAMRLAGYSTEENEALSFRGADGGGSSMGT